ncbi:hypothetical protein JSQ81_05855 [Sporosarcina sp. Marseille-Q4063]|uniref:hypothetical protein n=1 Tax=Sporosarcina sp. Marseille-Q4063 TaxID=2810514 RepID=UPI001BAFED53|nr:hypothetical protein [Sporosarcina sp. Marseille-Q4063]QUW23091.1 hypothetical protein JSQ81_05855 [Sporosarcina sp. Marseille-Q4063]
MKQNANKLLSILGWLLFLVAIGLFVLQIGYLLLQHKFQMEYIDNRLFYLINISIVVCLYGAIILFNFTRRFKAIATGYAGVFIIISLFLLVQSNKEIKNIISISPDANNVFSVKKTQLGEDIYYRSYYGILARPKATLPYPITGEYHVEWLANDVAVFTYQTNDNKVQTFVGTYGDRKPGGSYYYVGMEMQGVWQNGNIKVVSKPDGIHVMENNHDEFFEWDNVHQFGTLAIVLERDDQAIWTIALNEDFELYSNASVPPTGSISLYKATVGNKESYDLKYITSN